MGAKGKQADTAGALREAASQGRGIIILWLLVAGFAGLALWRLSEAAYGQPGRKGRTPGQPLQSLGSGATQAGAGPFTRRRSPAVLAARSAH
jgi:hypothetical protein